MAANAIVPKRHRLVHPWLTEDAFAKLEAEASVREVHPDALAAQVLEIIARDGLFLAVIDGR